MTVDLSTILEYLLWASLTVGGLLLLNYFAGRKWLLGLFESEGEPSIRLVLAAIVTVFALCMLAAGRLDDARLNTLCTFVGTLLLIGSARIVGKAWAARPPAPDTQIKAETAPVTGENVNVNAAPVNGTTSA
jgi:hypothetical protein